MILINCKSVSQKVTIRELISHHYHFCPYPAPMFSHLPEKYLTGFHVWGVAWLTVKFLSRSNITPTIRWQRHVRSCLYYIFVVCVVSHQNFGYPSQLSKGKSVRFFHIRKRLFMVKCPFTKILKRSTHKKVSYGQEGGQSQGWNLLKSGCFYFFIFTFLVKWHM